MYMAHDIHTFNCSRFAHPCVLGSLNTERTSSRDSFTVVTSCEHFVGQVPQTEMNFKNLLSPKDFVSPGMPFPQRFYLSRHASSTLFKGFDAMTQELLPRCTIVSCKLVYDCRLPNAKCIRISRTPIQL